MPVYDYFCEANQRTVEVSHPVDVTLRMWGELCYAAQIPLGDTDPLAPVRRVITRAPGFFATTSNAEYRDLGFTKLVKREDGVYEDVTRGGGDRRYLDTSSPEFRRKLQKGSRD